MNQKISMGPRAVQVACLPERAERARGDARDIAAGAAPPAQDLLP
jgi:hypothetical protein